MSDGGSATGPASAALDPGRLDGSRPTIVVGAPERLLRDSVRTILDDAGLAVTGSASDQWELAATVRTSHPGLLLLDPQLPGPQSPDELVGQMLDLGCRTLLLAPQEEGESLIVTIEAGALGFVSADADTDELLHSVRAALRGEACIPRRLLGAVLRGLIERRRAVDHEAELIGRLSPREREVLTFMGSGRSLEQIAGDLVISTSTVRTHVQKILGKLEVHSQIEAVNLAVEHGLVKGVAG